MLAQLSAALKRLGATVREFTVAQRTIALIGVAVLVLGAVSLTAWASKPTYTPLFSGLQAADANSIVEQLRTDGVSYQLTDGGGTILVPEKSVYDERLKAAAAGLPSAATGGYSLLDKMGVTSSEFQQSVTYKRAMEGELANTIGAIKGVKTASVRLAIPEKTVFVSKETDPTASVFVETQNGVTLSDEQVQAIVHLTSSSIDGMKPADVAVIDAAGTVLSTVGGTLGASGDKQATEYEQRIRTAVQAMLDRVVGPGNATVAVAADMNNESGTRTDESFTVPANAPALNESRTTESSTGNGGGAAGVLGPDNIAVPGGTGANGTAGANGTSNSESTTKNNALNKVTQSTTIPAGAVRRQTVSVAVNERVAGSLNMSDVFDLVSSAAGINTARGDQATVKTVAFNTASADEAAAALKAAEDAAAAKRAGDLLRTGLIILGVLLAIALAFFLYARRSGRANREPVDIGELEEFPGGSPLPPPGAAAVPLEPATSALQITPLPAAPALEPVLPEPEPDLESMDLNRKRAQIDALAQRDPAKTAEYLRGLMDDRAPV